MLQERKKFFQSFCMFFNGGSWGKKTTTMAWFDLCRREFCATQKSSIAVEGAFCITIVIVFMLVPLILAAVTFSNTLLAFRLADTLGISLYNGRSVSQGVAQNIVTNVLGKSGVNGVTATVFLTSFADTNQYFTTNPIVYSVTYNGGVTNFPGGNVSSDVGAVQAFLPMTLIYYNGLSSLRHPHSVVLFSRGNIILKGSDHQQFTGTTVAAGTTTIYLCVPSMVLTLPVLNRVFSGLPWWNAARGQACGFMKMFIPGSQQQIKAYAKWASKFPNANQYGY